MKANLFSHLGLVTIVLAIFVFDQWLKTVEVRSDRPARHAAVRFVPSRFDPAGFAPLRLAGAWAVEMEDPRFGGVSALAVDGDHLIALSDSGSVFRFPMPGHYGMASVRDLPGGPGTPQFKVNRDSEALARDPAGRGWWVAFEFWHELWLYDSEFRNALATVKLGENRWRDNRGIEALVPGRKGLLIFPEVGDEWLEVVGNRLDAGRLANSYGAVTDGVRLADGRLLLVTRKFGLAGIAKRLVGVERRGPNLTLRRIATIDLSPMDNVEAVAADPRTGGTRLWLMTDDDFRPRKATLLVALDLP